MGCGGHKQKRASPRSTEAHTDPIVANSKKEIEEIAELPLRAKDEETDLISMVEVSIKCSEVAGPTKSVLPKTFAVFYKETAENAWVECGRTEPIFDCSHPEFITTFCTAYSFEKQQKLRFELYEVSQLSDPEQLTKQALLGECAISIHELVGLPTQSITKELQPLSTRKKPPGYMTISTEPMSDCKEVALMTWEWEGNSSGSLCVRMMRSGEVEGRRIPIYESESSDKSSARWKPFKLSVDTLCKGDSSRELLFELYRTQKNKERTMLGTASSCIADMKSAGVGLRLDVSSSGSVLGRLKLAAFSVTEEGSFLDFVYGGCEISLIIGIDFTKSNGSPTDRSSLHFLDAAHPNEYIQAITEVGDILQYYDSDKRIPVFGFGAKLPPTFTHVSHCFALNGDIFDPEVQGIGRVVEVYKAMCKEVSFHGPTMFSPLIHMASQYAAAQQVTQSTQHYYILLILTDGIINDMEQTLLEVVEASELPMSIIIVGIGPENFEMMKVLDADETALYSKHTKKTAQRDIVQFVPFREVKENQLELARQVLYEIPKQMLGFMAEKGIKPNAKREAEARGSGQRSGMGGLTPKRIHLPPLFESPRQSPFDSLVSRFIEEMTQYGCDPTVLLEETNSGLLCAEPAYVLEILNARGAQATTKLKPALRKEKRREKRTGSGKVVRMASDEEQVCRICRKMPISTILIECGHRVVCQVCALGLTNKECPVCKKTFARWVLTYDV